MANVAGTACSWSAALICHIVWLTDYPTAPMLLTFMMFISLITILCLQILYNINVIIIKIKSHKNVNIINISKNCIIKFRLLDNLTKTVGKCVWLKYDIEI